MIQASVPSEAPDPPIACRLEVLPGRTVFEQICSAHRMGFDGIALPGRFLKQWLAPLRECRADSPLPLVSISLGFEGSLLSPVEAVRQRCRDSLRRLFDLGAELGVSRINLPPCLIQDHPERITDAGEFGSVTARQDALLLEQLPALGDAARARGVILLLEPVNRYESDYLHSLVHAAQLCRQLDHPAIGVTADFFHMQLEELQPEAALRTAGAWIRHVHVAENTRVEPGPGSLNFQPGFRALRDSGYAGWIEIECRTLSGPAFEVLPKSLRYLRAVWAAGREHGTGGAGE